MARVITLDEAALAARRQFLATARIDMPSLAEELAVARATLYRVAGGRDRLLGHVIADLGQATQRQAMADAAGHHPPGVERVVDAAHRMNAQVVAFGPLRTLIAADPETAFRVLFTDRGGVHERSVALWAAAIREALQAEGRPGDPSRLAYMFVRIGESAIFADLLSHREPDLDLARDLQRALLLLSRAG